MPNCVKCGKKGLLLKVNFESLCENCQKEELETLRNMLSPEQKEVITLQEQISSLAQRLNELHRHHDSLIAENNNLETTIKDKKAQILRIEDQLYFQDFCLYTPRFRFQTSEEYKATIDKLRDQQKQIIKNNRAILFSHTFAYNGSAAQGKKLMKDMCKLFLRAFNCECDDVIDHVKYNNYDLSVKRITASANTIEKLGKMMMISVSKEYFDAKMDELSLVYEYKSIKQKEKEEQKALREQLREEQKVLKEIEEERKKVEKERSHYINALQKIMEQLEENPENVDLISKKNELESGIEDANKAIENIDYRVANKRAGYVYIISNIGSFGKDVYKIGMTRRLDPTERIDELSDASVPFNFDIHAMIFTDDAPALEAALHKAFEDKRVNMINHRREFFNVTLDEIKEVVHKNYDKVAEFIDVADAEQYYSTLKIKEMN